VDGADRNQREAMIPTLFPQSTPITRPPQFPDKEIIFVSARVHPGEVPAQHTFKGIFNLLMDKNDKYAIELRKHYVFKLIPMLNPDGKCLLDFLFHLLEQ
jgi:murein tripeptide amidase MpaA